MANIFDELDNELEIDQDNDIVATDDESSSIPKTQVQQFQNQLVEGKNEPIKIDMLPGMDEVPFDESKLEQPKQSTAQRYLEALSKIKNQDDNNYNESFDKGNKLKLYGNLLNSFNNTIKNSMATVVPNFQEEKAVPEALRQQGSDLVSEFYKRRQNERAQQDQAAANIKNLNAMESSDLDLQEKRSMYDPNSRLVNIAKKTIKAFDKKGLITDEDMDNMNYSKLTEVANLLKQNRNDELAAALGWANLAEKKESNKANRELKEEAAAQRKEEKARLSDKQITDITNLDNALDQMGIIESEKKDINTGPIAGRSNSIAKFFGIDDSKVSGFRSSVGSQLADYIKSISGAAVSDNERKFLLDNMPNMNDSDETFLTKLNIVKARLRQNRDNFVNNIKRQGKNTSSFDRASDVSDTNSTSSGPLGDMVKRKDANGVTRDYKWNAAVGKYQPLK